MAEAKSQVPPESGERHDLRSTLKREQGEFDTSLVASDLTPEARSLYASLEPRSLETGDTATDLSLRTIGRGVANDIRGNRLTQAILTGLGVQTAGRIIAEADGDPSAALSIFIDNLTRWSGNVIDTPDPLLILTAIAGAAVYVGAPAKVIEFIATAQSRRTSEQVRKDTQLRDKEAQRTGLIREGRANLDSLVGPNVQIDVGRSDPSARLLIDAFHADDIGVVTFWDTANPLFDAASNPAWQRTDNDWTNRDALLRGDIREAVCAVTLVSNGDDVFLSSERQDPSRKMQDMTDNEAIGAINARDRERRELYLPTMKHILVTNPRRKIEVSIAGTGHEGIVARTVEEVVRDKYSNVELVDPDELVLDMLATVAQAENLPIELLTNPERSEEYNENLKGAVEGHNKKSPDRQLRFATADDGKRTLTVVYGSTDEDTITQIQTYGDRFAANGDMMAVINDPEKVGRLPEGVKYICVGQVVAKAVHSKFKELVPSPQ